MIIIRLGDDLRRLRVEDSAERQLLDRRKTENPQGTAFSQGIFSATMRAAPTGF
jgi:hypothetical protein